MNLKCPNTECTSQLFMAFNEKTHQYTCMMCGFIIDSTEEEVKEKPEVHRFDEEAIKNAFDKAKNILESNLDRKINLKLTLGGEWGKRFVALQTLTEALQVDPTQLVGGIVKNGIHAMFNVFSNIASAREGMQKMVDEGMFRQETVDNLMADMDKVSQNPDFDFGFEGTNEEEE